MSIINVEEIRHFTGAPCITIDANGDATFENNVNLAADGINVGILTTTNLYTSNVNGYQLAGMRNKIINGTMISAQRGTSISPVGVTTYTMDRWLYGVTGSTAVVTITQDTDVPANSEFDFSIKIDVTTTDSTVDAGDAVNIQQRIEGYNIIDLVGNTFTVSFWVKSALAGIYCLAIRSGGSDRSYITEYTILTANVWQYVKITIPGGLPSSGTWDFINGYGLSVTFTLMGGSTFQTTAGSWQNGNFVGTSNQVNFFNSTANNFWLTGVQLEKGSIATPFEHRLIGLESFLCRRYYQVNTYELINGGTASNMGVKIPYQVLMRATPTSTVISYAYGIFNSITPEQDGIRLTVGLGAAAYGLISVSAEL